MLDAKGEDMVRGALTLDFLVAGDGSSWGALLLLA